jgi:acetyl esterase
MTDQVLTQPGPIEPEVIALLQSFAVGGPAPGAAPPSVYDIRAGLKAIAAARPAGPELARVENVTITLPDREIAARLYVDSEPCEALIVFFHGGGWSVGGLDESDAPLRRFAQGARCAILSVDYRMAPEHIFPAAVDDALAATQWAGENRGALTGDAAIPLVVAGESAGGNLAAVVAQLSRTAGPVLDAQVLLEPGLSAELGEAFAAVLQPPFLSSEEIASSHDRYVPDPAMRADPRFAPLLTQDLSGLAPAFIGTVERDLIRMDAERYAERLRDAGVPTVVTCYTGTFHAFFELDMGLRHSLQAIDDIRAFLQDNIRKERPSPSN